MWVVGGGGLDRICRDLIGGGILMLAGSGSILRRVMDDIGRIAKGGGEDIMDVGDGEAFLLSTSHDWIR